VPDDKKPTPSPARKLARAAESGDPAVHQLLAEKQTAMANDNKVEAEAVTKKLAELGYE